LRFAVIVLTTSTQTVIAGLDPAIQESRINTADFAPAGLPGQARQ
jgi:hypothetical protein